MSFQLIFSPQFYSIFFILILLPTSYSNGVDESLMDCFHPFSCGDLKNLSYPFWTDDHPQHCHLEGFELIKCEDPQPLILISGHEFRVLHINQSVYRMTIVRIDLWEDTCPKNFVNVTLEHPFLHYSKTNQNLTVFFNCIPWIEMPCENMVQRLVDPFYATDPFVIRDNFQHLRKCGTSVQVNKTNFDRLRNRKLNLLEALKQGFDMEYDFYEIFCSKCKDLGGKCFKSSSDLLCKHGGANDIQANTNGKLPNNLLVVSFGEMLMDFVPTVGGVSLAEAPAFKMSPGGAPANVAVGISRLGGSSAFIGKVGDDEFGHILADILRQNNVNSSGLRFDHSARTALSFVTLRSDGEREFLFFRHPSADMNLRKSELDINLIKQAGIFHFGSISLIEEPCRSAHLAAMSIARKSGSILSYDPNLRLPLWPSAEAAREGIKSIWDQADVIKISEDELTFFIEDDDTYDDNVVMEKLFRPNLKLLVVTEGSKGCRYYTKTFKGRVPGIKVKAVDTTGAGDAFVSGMLTSLASDIKLIEDEKRLREALLFANACGALTVTKGGAIPALPTKEAVLEVLKGVAAS
ncbi:probable fructokinase-7 isoform X1 [Durio zibethinus]|uniref:Probable fructokinase-7 isoform X1 n=1 Tax=Durio zibethinus TaxID=66656 RepID=A0A6P6AL02_DURZI|nr:probable fructokinase-7 isoform X1 [Durio zibethinus]